MLTLLGFLIVVVGPILVVGPLLWLANRLERARHEVRARQAAVTDAIHRQLGAVVAPPVRKRLWGPWQILIPVPLGRPALVSRVLAIAQAALAPIDGTQPGRLQFVLVAQEEGRADGRP